ncbi:acyl-CoA dehydrogenase family protein [Nocardioides daejeonensis]|uniref:acyl-CoA dehydrogenase family protein n=1 Tax=Nocardioides daejeonensis TaxID=1046556 RepID=UPI0013A564EB|nr:acyl-CoA dehydrogenase family protein [Nocardioides daejeonensis]
MSSRDDLRDIRAALSDVLDAAMPTSAIRADAASAHGYDRTLWAELASGFGITGMHAAEGAEGPLDLDPIWVVAELLGARLAALPYLSTVVLGTLPLLRAERTDAGSEVLGELLEGRLTATSAEPVQGWRRHEGRLSGSSSAVLHGTDSDWILLVDDGRVYGVHDPAGVTREPVASIDLTRPTSAIDFQEASLIELGTLSLEQQDRCRADLLTYLTHECAGGLRRVKDMAVQHLRDRHQFGVPLGSFQALKHRAADLAVDTVTSTAVARAAAAAVNTPAYLPAAERAFLFASDAYVRAASSSLHMHGGLGFTWEFDSHLYYRRAYASTALAGRSSATRCRLGQRLMASA